GFAITVLPDAPFTQRQLVSFLESRKISTRRFFGGNLTRHPAYQDVPHRVSGDLTNADIVTEHTFWVGVYPGLSADAIDYVTSCVREFAKAV
ncbi:DegT/DnrJ/EryC1/StrS family aminotransferase, partial [Kibdelosporangium lantanae]